MCWSSKSAENEKTCVTWASIPLRSASLYRGRYLCRIRSACCLKMAVTYTALSNAETGLLKTPYAKITPSSEVVPVGRRTEPASALTGSRGAFCHSFSSFKIVNGFYSTYFTAGKYVVLYHKSHRAKKMCFHIDEPTWYKNEFCICCFYIFRIAKWF